MLSFIRGLMLIVFLYILLQGKNMNIYDFTVDSIDGETISLSEYKNKVLLIVNVASECAFTPQYEGLEKLYQNFKDKNFMILAFPSNQFAKQESQNNQKIKYFCTSKYNVSFDLFAKINVNGESAIDLYKFLKKEKTGFLWTKFIKWNFTKFLINKNGEVVKRYAPSTKPEYIKDDIEKLLTID